MTDRNIPEAKWNGRIIYMVKYNNTSILSSSELFKSIDKELYEDFRIYPIILSSLGLFYSVKLCKTNIENIYEIDSIDLAYWHKVLFNKLRINNKPTKPTIYIPDCSDISDIGNIIIQPIHIEFYCSNGNNSSNIFEVMMIEKN